MPQKGVFCMSDQVLHFSGESGVEFMEALAKALADSLTFDNHGAMSDDEKAAFLWGFRHGVTQAIGLLQQAHDEGPNAYDIVSRVVAESIGAWDLRARATLAAVLMAKPNGETPASGVH